MLRPSLQFSLISSQAKNSLSNLPDSNRLPNVPLPRRSTNSATKQQSVTSIAHTTRPDSLPIIVPCQVPIANTATVHCAPPRAPHVHADRHKTKPKPMLIPLRSGQPQPAPSHSSARFMCSAVCCAYNIPNWLLHGKPIDLSVDSIANVIKSTAFRSCKPFR